MLKNYLKLIVFAMISINFSEKNILASQENIVVCKEQSQDLANVEKLDLTPSERYSSVSYNFNQKETEVERAAYLADQTIYRTGAACVRLGCVFKDKLEDSLLVAQREKKQQEMTMLDSIKEDGSQDSDSVSSYKGPIVAVSSELRNFSGDDDETPARQESYHALNNSPVDAAQQDDDDTVTF